MRSMALVALKTLHTIIWLTVEAALGYVLWAGFKRRSDRRVAMAAGVVVVESTVFLANGARCPLTGLAESLGADRGGVTDIFLPRWLAQRLPALHLPLVAVAFTLHLRNARGR